MRLRGASNVWAIGDCALIVNARDGQPSPTTGQFAERQGRQCAQNIARVLRGEPTKPFYFKQLGELCSIGGHSAVARDFETIRSRVRGREDLVDEMSGAASAGLVRAHAMLAAAIAPRNEALSALAAEARPDPDAVRRELLAAVGGRTQWHPPGEPAP